MYKHSSLQLFYYHPIMSPCLGSCPLAEKEMRADKMVRESEADRHKARQGGGGGGERHSVFEIRCILMSSPCSINDDLCCLQIEYSPLSERETVTMLTPPLSNHFL